MSKTHLTVEITTPQGQIYQSADIDKVILPGKHGIMTILPGHIDISAILKEGDVSIYGLKCEQECEHLKISGGFVQVTDNYLVNILTEHLQKDT